MSLQGARGLRVWALQRRTLRFTNIFEVERWHKMWAFYMNCNLWGDKRNADFANEQTAQRHINKEQNIVFSYLYSPRLKCNQLFVFANFKVFTFNWRYTDPFWPNYALNYCTKVCGMCINLYLTACAYLFTKMETTKTYSDLLPVGGTSKIDKWASTSNISPAILFYASFGSTKMSKFISKVLLLHAIILEVQIPVSRVERRSFVGGYRRRQGRDCLRN